MSQQNPKYEFQLTDKLIMPPVSINVLACEIQTSQPQDPLLNLEQTHAQITPITKSEKVRGRHQIENLISKSSPNEFAVKYDWGKVWGKEVF
jgi:hypothetical protein